MPAPERFCQFRRPRRSQCRRPAAAAGVLTFGHLLQKTGAVAHVSRRHDDRSTSDGSGSAASNLGGSAGLGIGIAGLGGSAGQRAGDRFVTLALGFRRRSRLPSAAATTTATGPGVARNTSVTAGSPLPSFLGPRWEPGQRDQQHAEHSEME
jgi:hypothetical protein